MKILILVHGFPPRERAGVELVASEQARDLAARGHDVLVFARSARPGGPGPGVQTFDEKMGAVRLRRVEHDPLSLDHFSQAWCSPALDAVFAATLDEFSPDVVHVQHLVALSTRLLDACRARQIPWVVSLHDFFFLCHRLFLLDDQGRRCAGPDAGLRCAPCLAELGATPDEARQRFEAMVRVLGFAASVTAPSRGHASRYEAELPFLAGRIEIVPPGLDLPVPRTRARINSTGNVRLLFVGPLLPHKGVDLLLQSLRRIGTAEPGEGKALGENSIDENPKHGDGEPGPEARRPAALAGGWQLQVRGDLVPQFESFAAFVHELAHGLAVDFRPGFPPEDLAEVLAAADVLVLPSRCDESWSRLMREARFAGLAVVVPSSGGPAEDLIDGIDALLVAPDDVSALSVALGRLVADRSLLLRLQTARPPMVSAPALVAARLEAILETAVARSTPALPRVTVAYVVKNGLPELAESLAAVRAQQGNFELVEILAIDSGSRDGSREALEQAGVRVVDIPAESFGHGRTRNLAAQAAAGDFIAFLTQDATPHGAQWLDPLVRTLESDPLLAGVWSRHIPRPDCHPMERRSLSEFPPFASREPWVAQARGNPQYAAHPEPLWWFSNNACLIRRDLLLRQPLPEVWFGEDRAWAKKILEAGWRTQLVRDSVIRHSHSYGAVENLRRHYDHARAMRDVFGWRDQAGLGECARGSLRETRRDLTWLRSQEGTTAALRWASRALKYQTAAWAGRWLAAREPRLPARLKGRLSLHEQRLVGMDASR